jgi:hypothetical protein
MNLYMHHETGLPYFKQNAFPLGAGLPLQSSAAGWKTLILDKSEPQMPL